MTAVKERHAGVEYLRQHIPALEVVWDETGDAMQTFVTACEAVSDDDGVVRLEDDICLTCGFVEKVEAVIGSHESDVVQFFSRSKYDHLTGARWSTTFSMNQCFYLPPGVSSQLAAFYTSSWWDAERLIHPTGYDIMMTKMFRGQRRKHWISVPSLVEHATTPSLIKRGRSRWRQSMTFVDPELDGYPYSCPGA